MLAIKNYLAAILVKNLRPLQLLLKSDTNLLTRIVQGKNKVWVIETKWCLVQLKCKGVHI